jgi:hypothetical protein
MSDAIQFESETSESIDDRSIPCSCPNDEFPRFIACLILSPEDAEPILKLLGRLAVRVSALSPCQVATDGPNPKAPTDIDRWLGHAEAAAYLGVSTSTLYHYSCHEQIERRKLGGRLEYRRSVLDKFKQAHVLPASSASTPARIIATAHSSGK